MTYRGEYLGKLSAILEDCEFSKVRLLVIIMLLSIKLLRLTCWNQT